MPLTLEHPLAVIDIETTGLSVTKDRIVEIAIIKLLPDGRELFKREFVNPEMTISQEATAIHGITNQQVQDAPLFSQLADEIKQFIADCDFSGYNCLRFDLPLLNEEFLRVGIEFDMCDHTVVDVQRIFHKMEPRDLPAAYKFYCGKDMQNHHDPEADVRATLDVLRQQISKYSELGTTASDIEKSVGRSKSLDSMNRIVLHEGVAVFNFGKHKGKTVSQVFEQEPHYYDWIMKSDFALHTKKVLSALHAQKIANTPK